jgi:predicted alpha/beta hydrolase
VFGAVFVAGLLAVLVGAAIGSSVGGLAYAASGHGSSTVIVAVSWAVGAIFQAFNACVVATLYYFLRRDKEGVDIHQIAAVFD